MSGTCKSCSQDGHVLGCDWSSCSEYRHHSRVNNSNNCLINQKSNFNSFVLIYCNFCMSLYFDFKTRESQSSWYVIAYRMSQFLWPIPWPKTLTKIEIPTIGLLQMSCSLDCARSMDSSGTDTNRLLQ